MEDLKRSRRLVKVLLDEEILINYLLGVLKLGYHSAIEELKDVYLLWKLGKRLFFLWNLHAEPSSYLSPLKDLLAVYEVIFYSRPSKISFSFKTFKWICSFYDLIPPLLLYPKIPFPPNLFSIGNEKHKISLLPPRIH